MQKVVPETDTLFVRVASNGKRICVIKSVDGTTITSFCVHECEGSSRVGSRPRRFVITGHSSGAVQGRRRKRFAGQLHLSVGNFWVVRVGKFIGSIC